MSRDLMDDDFAFELDDFGDEEADDVEDEEDAEDEMGFDEFGDESDLDGNEDESDEDVLGLDDEDEFGLHAAEDEFGAELDSMGFLVLALGKRNRYSRQARIFRNRYKRFVRRTEEGKGERAERTMKRIGRTWDRLNRLWEKLDENQRVGLESPDKIRAGVLALYGQPDQEDPTATAPVLPGLASSSIVPSLTSVQAEEVQRQAAATNFARRYSSPPVSAPIPQIVPQTTGGQQVFYFDGRAYASLAEAHAARRAAAASGRAYVPGVPPVASPAPAPTPLRMTRPVPPGAAPRPLVRPAPTPAIAPRPLVRPSPVPPPIQVPRPLVRPAAAPVVPGRNLTPGRPLVQPAPDAVRVRLPGRPVQMPAAPASAPAAAAATSRRSSAPGTMVFQPRVAINPSQGTARVRLGEDAFGQDGASLGLPGGVQVNLPPGYSVTPNFATVASSAVENHPLKTLAVVGAVFAAGVLLSEPVMGLYRSR